jgi:hypothetical protein
LQRFAYLINTAARSSPSNATLRFSRSSRSTLLTLFYVGKRAESRRWAAMLFDVFKRGVQVSLRKGLFAFSFLAQSLGCFLVNFPPVADGKYPDHSRFAIRFIDNAKAPDLDSPQAGQFSDERHTGERVGG